MLGRRPKNFRRNFVPADETPAVPVDALGVPDPGAPELQVKLASNFEMEHRFLWHQLVIAPDSSKKIVYEYFWLFGEALKRKFPADETPYTTEGNTPLAGKTRPKGVPTDAQLQTVLSVPFGAMGKGVAIKMFRDVQNENDKGRWVRGTLFRVMAAGEYGSVDGMRPYATIQEATLEEPIRSGIHSGNPGLELLRQVFHAAFQAEEGFLSAPDAETLQRKYETDAHPDKDRALVNLFGGTRGRVLSIPFRTKFSGHFPRFLFA